MDNGIARVAAGEKHNSSWPAPPNLISQLATVNAPRKHDIREKQIDLWVVVERGQGGRGVGCLDDLIAELSQDPT